MRSMPALGSLSRTPTCQAEGVHWARWSEAGWGNPCVIYAVAGMGQPVLRCMVPKPNPEFALASVGSLALPAPTYHLLSDMDPLVPVCLVARGGHRGQASLLAWGAAGRCALVCRARGVCV